MLIKKNKNGPEGTNLLNIREQARLRNFPLLISPLHINKLIMCNVIEYCNAKIAILLNCIK